MLARTYGNQFCSVAWTLEVIGERWSLLIVRDAMLGVSRFGEFRRRLGVAPNVLAVRLNRLASAGVLERVPYQQRPVRYEYRLTAKGEELVLVVLALMQWGDRHLAGDSGPPRTTHHVGCEGLVEPRLACRACANEPDLAEIVIRGRTGATLRSGGQRSGVR